MTTNDSTVPAGAPTEVARLTLADRECRVLCVDDVVPRHSDTRDDARPRLTYAEREVAHFQLGGHRYALVSDEPLALAASPRARGGHPDDIRALLTNRELQIVQLICMGCLTKQVADRLHLSEFTVRSYLKTVYCKLGVRSRGAMVYRYAQAFKHAPG